MEAHIRTTPASPGMSPWFSTVAVATKGAPHPGSAGSRTTDVTTKSGFIQLGGAASAYVRVRWLLPSLFSSAASSASTNARAWCVPAAAGAVSANASVRLSPTARIPAACSASPASPAEALVGMEAHIRTTPASPGMSPWFSTVAVATKVSPAAGAAGCTSRRVTT